MKNPWIKRRAERELDRIVVLPDGTRMTWREYFQRLLQKQQAGKMVVVLVPEGEA